MRRLERRPTGLRRRLRSGIAVAVLTVVATAGTADADTLRGTVGSVNGDPVGGADFDVFTIDGALLEVDDNSDPDGTYEIALPPGRYDVICEPLIASGLAPQARRGILLNGDVKLDWALPPSHRVLGRVVGANGAGIPGADLDFDRAAEGVRQPVLGDRTSLFGTFAAYVAEGTYDITIFPLTETGLAPARLRSVSIPTSDTLAITLVPASRLSGHVVDEFGIPVVGARLSFVDSATRERVPASGTSTAQDGGFLAAVAPGTYDVTVRAPSGATLVAARYGPLDLMSDASLEVVLGPGVVVDGQVLDRDGVPLVAADWDVADEATGRSVSVSDDETDYSGRFRFVLRPDIYRLLLTPAAGSGLAPQLIRNVSVQRDTTINVSYGSTPAALPARLKIAPAGNPTHRRGDLLLSLDRDGPMEVLLIDVAGRLVRRWQAARLPAGTHRISWDGRDRSGRQVGVGVYFVRARQGTQTGFARWVILQ
ncbi:MAG: carboxypeptidase regulatory-like domain-containing protein [Candidatus Eisenbacteria bacterium]